MGGGGGGSLTKAINYHMMMIKGSKVAKSIQPWVESRVLARISKMSVQNSNFKISARPDLATNLLQIFIPAIIYSLVCLEGQFTVQLCLRRWFL